MSFAWFTNELRSRIFYWLSYVNDKKFCIFYLENLHQGHRFWMQKQQKHTTVANPNKLAIIHLKRTSGVTSSNGRKQKQKQNKKNR